jgi:Spy/CpxP family protein refolding chaperone
VALERMGAALAALSTALASGDVAAVLTAERPLADAVRQLPGRGLTLTPEERSRLRDLIAGAARALHRCRQLGEAAREMAAAGIAAHHGYGRSGALVTTSPRTTVDSRS